MSGERQELQTRFDADNVDGYKTGLQKLFPIMATLSFIVSTYLKEFDAPNLGVYQRLREIWPRERTYHDCSYLI